MNHERTRREWLLLVLFGFILGLILGAHFGLGIGLAIGFGIEMPDSPD